MKRIRNRLAGAVIGVVLGLWAAGFTTTSWASPDAATTQPASLKAESAEHPDKEHATHGHGAEHDGGLAAAAQLVPRQSDIPFFRPVLMVVGGLFVAAVVLGIPALKLKGPDLPDPAASHDDHAHDAHGHDAHGGHDAHAKGHDHGHAKH